MFEIIHSGSDTYNDGYVDITNSGSSDGDLLGYTVEDGTGSTYSFLNGYSLAAGETVRLHSGDGTNMSTDIDEHGTGKSHFRDLVYLDSARESRPSGCH